MIGQKQYDVVVIPGDGIGPEVTDAMLQVIEATGVKVYANFQTAGLDAIDKFGVALPKATVEAIRKYQVAIKGPTGTPKGKGHTSSNVQLRKELDLYANVRPVKAFEGVPTFFPEMNLVIFRENTEDVYAASEEYINDSHTVVETKFITTQRASYRIFKAAFEYARENGFDKVTAIHKSNISKLSHGLFQHSGEQVAAQYPNIEFIPDLLMDNACMQLQRDPSQFQVIVTTNAYGDILSDLCAGMAHRSLGIMPGANIGDKYALFEAVHGTADDIAGKGLANPTAVILSGAMMLDYLGEPLAADFIRAAVIGVLKEGVFVTGDINKTSPVGTEEMTAAICRRIVNLKLAKVGVAKNGG